MTVEAGINLGTICYVLPQCLNTTQSSPLSTTNVFYRQVVLAG